MSATIMDEATALERVGGSRETLREVRALLVEGTPPLMRDMIDAIATEDWGALGVAAHSCKGMYLVFEPNAVESIALEIEVMAEEGTVNTDAATRALGRLSAAIIEVQAALGIRAGRYQR